MHGHLGCDQTGNMLMHSVCADIQECASGRAHQLVKIHVQLQLDLLLVFSSLSVPNGWDHMHAKNDMNAAEFPCM